MALVTTPGAADADSYATLAEALAYNASRPFATDWVASGVTDGNREAALMQATSLLDLSFQWTGVPTDGVQALCWPRTGMLTLNGFPIPTDEIPARLKNAESELARQLLVADRTADLDSETGALKSVGVGSVNVTFQDKSGSAASSLSMMDAAIRRMRPEFADINKAIPDAVRLMLVPSWYRRESILRPLIFDVHR